MAELCGRPLIAYPLAAMESVLREVAVLVKPDTQLPELPGAQVWIEPPGEPHPLRGLVHALERAAGRAVLVCAGDLPLVSGALIARLASADEAGAPAVVSTCRGSLQPLLGCYRPSALAALRPAAQDGARAREAVESLEPIQIEVFDADELFNVNTPEDLRRAEAVVNRRAANRT